MSRFLPPAWHPTAALTLLAGSLLATPALGATPLPSPAPKAPTMLASSQSLSDTQGQWPVDGWWRAYGDEQLSTLIAEGLQGATDLRVAQARYAAAAATVGDARGALLPRLSGNADGGLAKQSYNYLFPAAFAPKGWRETGQASLNLNWEIDFWGKNRAALRAAKADRSAAEAEAAASRLAVSTGIATAYADLAASYAEQDAAQEAAKIRAQTLALIEQRRDQGLENEGAVARARANLASAQGDLAAIDEQIALGRHRLAALIGAGPDRGLSIARPAVAHLASPGLPENIPAQLLGRRPDMVAARAHAEAAGERIKVARAAFYPNINLSALIGLQSLGLSNLVKSGSEYGSVGPAVTLPIFDGGRLTARKHGAEADYALAVAQYDGTLVHALQEIADAATSRQELTRRLSSAQAAQAAAQSAWDVANNRYRGGLATVLDVLVAEDSLIAARRATAALQTRAFALDVALVRALGGGFQA
ncbi:MULTISPECIES: efflux transporter outer membrane subunit [unclassified Novosphingobium]|uniref:efflux transporter outer membrane subunit n=2 Tax=Novosphingobium TaxID=165696 RepID=UPI00095ADBA1|nr:MULTISPECIES: efflux transporter outer membrane subunit [unclassified Novosphingobium]MDR6708766.1 NodT family efflux transporter outer membrane factor (OMF) lipoprotein [Novosphingobium sp. 1748]NKI98170.1 NodT family efflux transporter outer membrane factor (OMF) lipoprotein [Novosphingobium sp. SG707]OJX96623.1 MAG: multidrug transporter [Novosphingobium sp. 63-713]